MRLTEVTYNDTLPIDSYGPGFFRVGGIVHEGALIVAPGGPASWQGFTDFSAILDLAATFDVLLIGTGPEVAPLPKALREALDTAAIGYDQMSTPTACRSYNILLAEGRRVLAALIPV